ncbi:hypothetical protein X740_15970 [Mesorhizobium sp. LNHC221B00]|nr:hypothetical protein X740_15970 [Mesorhizobium sp. LNHC221B00]
MQRTLPPETARVLVSPELLADKSRCCAKFGSSITLSRSGVLTCGLTAATANMSISTEIRSASNTPGVCAGCQFSPMIINGMRQRLNESVRARVILVN